MKLMKAWSLGAVSLGVVALTLTATAQVNTNPVPNLAISWIIDQYGFDNAPGGGGLPVPNTAAGLALATNWNDGWNENYSTGAYGNPVTVKNLWDSTGAASTLNLAYNSYNNSPIVNRHVGPDADGSYNREMLNGYLNAGPAAWGPPTTNSSVALTNIPYANYDVVVYFSSDTSGRNSSISDGATTYYFTTVGAAEVSGANALFSPTTQTNSTVFPSADFAFFPGLTGSTNTFTTYPKSGNDQWLGIAAFQVIQSSNVYVLFGPNPPAPIISVGQPASFSVLAGGLNPHYQWQHAGTNILNATNATYAIATTVAAQNGGYAVVVTNSFSSVTSAVASLTFYAPKTDEWVGGISSTWDTTTFNWTLNGGLTTTNYSDTDNVRFDPLGESQSTVSLGGTVSPTSLTVSNASYLLNAQTSGSLAGGGSLHVTHNGTLVLDTLDSRTGPTLIDSGSTMQLDNGDNVGGLGSGALTNNGTLQFDSSDNYAYGFPIYGTGIVTNESSGGTITLGNSVNASYLVQTGSGTLLLQGANHLTGGLVVDAGTVLARVNTSLGGGAVQLNGGQLQLTFANDFTGTALTLGGGTLYGGQGGDNSYDGTVTQAVDSDIEVGVNATFTLNSIAGFNGGTYNFVLNGNGGSGTLVLAGTNNTWGSVTIEGGTLQIGNGGATSTLGEGTIAGVGSLSFDLAGNLTVTNPIAITGNLTQNGSGTLNLAGDLTQLSGAIFVDAGELAGTNTFNGPVNILPGATLAPGTPTTISTLTVNNDLNLGGNLVFKVNKSLVQSNDLVVVAGGLFNTNTGVVTVNNLGPALKVGDTFTLFSEAVNGGNTFSVNGAGVVWNNNLAVDGSISVASTNLPRPVITGVGTATAGGLVFSGTNGAPGGTYQLLAATNLTQSSWTVVAAGFFDGSGNFAVTNAITPGIPQQYYRLQLP